MAGDGDLEFERRRRSDLDVDQRADFTVGGARRYRLPAVFVVPPCGHGRTALSLSQKLRAETMGCRRPMSQEIFRKAPSAADSTRAQASSPEYRAARFLLTSDLTSRGCRASPGRWAAATGRRPQRLPARRLPCEPLPSPAAVRAGRGWPHRAPTQPSDWIALP